MSFAPFQQRRHNQNRSEQATETQNFGLNLRQEEQRRPALPNPAQRLGGLTQPMIHQTLQPSITLSTTFIPPHMQLYLPQSLGQQQQMQQTPGAFFTQAQAILNAGNSSLLTPYLPYLQAQKLLKGASQASHAQQTVPTLLRPQARLAAAFADQIRAQQAQAMSSCDGGSGSTIQGGLSSANSIDLQKQIKTQTAMMMAIKDNTAWQSVAIKTRDRQHSQGDLSSKLAGKREHLNSSSQEERQTAGKSGSGASMAKVSPKQNVFVTQSSEQVCSAEAAIEEGHSSQSSESLTQTEPEDDFEQEPKRRVFQCRHCTQSFSTRQGLGGHASKKHPGLSETYQAKVTRRQQRKNDRLVLSIAKDLLRAMAGEDGAVLDPLTAKLFKRQRKARIPSPSATQKSPKRGKNVKKIVTKMSEQDRGRIRRLKQKIWLLLKRKSNFKLQLVNHSPQIAAQIAYYSSELSPAPIQS